MDQGWRTICSVFFQLAERAAMDGFFAAGALSVPVLPKIELPPMPKPPIITDEDKADFHHFLSGIPDSLSEGEESMVFALWRALRHSKGLTLMAADVGSGSGLLWRRMTIAAKRLTCRSIQS